MMALSPAPAPLAVREDRDGTHCSWCCVPWTRGDFVPRTGWLCVVCAAKYEYLVTALLGVPPREHVDALNARGLRWPYFPDEERECEGVA
jgi:hypothetical protein